MTKTDRQMVFNKYGGKCAYCGCDLQRGWHVDHQDPCRRIMRWAPAHWFHDPHSEGRTWVEGKWHFVGYSNPEALHVDNLMPSCPSCNINKHDGTLEDFRSLITGFMKHLNKINTQYKIAKRYGLILEVISPIVFYFELQNPEI